MRPTVAKGIILYTTLAQYAEFPESFTFCTHFICMQASMRPGSQLCVSWDFTAAGGQGDWTSVGCATRTTNDPNVTRCECNHLTNFAVLVVS